MFFIQTRNDPVLIANSSSISFINYSVMITELKNNEKNKDVLYEKAIISRY